MTTDPDAPATLRQVAEMMVTVMGGQALAARSMHRDAADALQCMADEFHEIATAPAVAKADDMSDQFVKDAIAHGTAWQKLTFDVKTGTVKSERIEPAQVASPADPFAPMVEAAVDAFYERGTEYIRQQPMSCMRRAIAAAIEKAPCTEAMQKAWEESRCSGVTAAWRVFTHALAAELRGDKP